MKYRELIIDKKPVDYFKDSYELNQALNKLIRDIETDNASRFIKFCSCK